MPPAAIDVRNKSIKRLRIKISGIVQGVGFRPFVYRLAERFRLSGWVQNGSEGVLIEAQGEGASLDSLVVALELEAPPLSLISSITTAIIPVTAENGFSIAMSSGGGGSTLVSPDCDVCPDCLKELFDPADRRFGYPFINCTNCGPRYSIITETPYDRPNTTMSAFRMCSDCRREYEDPADRRFHAQPVACPVCGPRLKLLGPDGVTVDPDPLAGALAALKTGRIVAIKGIGGYHLAVDPFNSAAVRELRRRKRRDEKPFAIMTDSLRGVEELVYCSQIEARFLTGPERPILLLRRRDGNGIASEVAPANDYLGIMLPSSPLHYLLFGGSLTALVMTSANISDEPILYRDDDALAKLDGIADLFLTHDREIHAPCDDSVIRVFRTHPLMLRRSRGYVPRPVRIPPISRNVLALGGELKSALCLASGEQGVMSRHIGDLKSPVTLASVETVISGLKKLAGTSEEVVAHDLHPDYGSTLIADTLTGLPKIAVQHHHAHMASCMGENRLDGEVIGMIFDGAGYGADGSIWGGEFLVGGYSGFRRAGHLREMRLPGGDAAAGEPCRMAISVLFQLYGDDLFGLPLEAVREVEKEQRKIFLQMLGKGLNSPLTTSCGRLFDAVAGILGVRMKMSYEGQAAIELEGEAERGKCGELYSYGIISGKDGLILDWLPMMRSVVKEHLSGRKCSDIAAGFHRSLAAASAAVCREIRQESGLDRVVLSGGAFQNRLLSEEILTLLEADGFRVFTHRLVPPNDGGLALGQAMIAGRSQVCV
jgi:hydrogenase maturation protein HypF